MNKSKLTAFKGLVFASSLITMLPIHGITSIMSSAAALSPEGLLAQESVPIEIPTPQPVQGKKSGFTLYIWQPNGTIAEVVARISLKAKYGGKYLKERFLGDYQYKIKQKAKFENGFKWGDRIVVRLYDTQNKLIGYTEFACLPNHTTVNLIIPANSPENPLVRVFYGVDSDEDGIVDPDTTMSYDYFTEIRNQKATFLSSPQNIDITPYQAAGFARVAQPSTYPLSFREGQFALVGKTISINNSQLAKALLSPPGSLVKLNQISERPYQLSDLLSKYREVGVAKGIRVRFSDITQNYWAKDYIGELAAMEIIEGYPDGTFRPNAPITRAQLATLLPKIFFQDKVKGRVTFRDIPKNHWAYNAIQETYQMGILTFGANRKFRPDQKLTRLDVLTTIARALNYKFTGSTKDILSIYQDTFAIRSEHRELIAALTENGVVVNYPNIRLLNTTKLVTRAEVCALLYRAMVSQGNVPDFSSVYTVRSNSK
ncbi:MAG: S-layer homology domain-containing protein [Sphaerospermopsis sp.]|nr:S-layer homology domain-containing protein [Sphaerospermopsis sp.]